MLLAASVSPSALSDEPEPTLIGHWRLDGKAINSVDTESAVVDTNGRFETYDSRPAARFVGGDHFISDTSRLLDVGTDDFTVAVWINLDDSDEDTPGDVLTMTDSSGQVWRMSIATRSGVAHSQSNFRQLHFGIDDATTGEWVDQGRPGEAVFVHALAVNNGELFAGTCEPGADQAGHVYRFAGDTAWVDCGSPDKSNAVTSLASHDGQLYAGTGKYRLAGSALAESENGNFGGKVFRYDGEKQWSLMGALPDVEAIGGIVGFQGSLFASSLYRPAALYHSLPNGDWGQSPLPPGEKRVESMIVFDQQLFATSYDNGNVYRFDGKTWTDTGPLGNATQGYAFAIYQGELYCSTWPEARVYKYIADGDWKDVGRTGEELEVMGMMVYNGRLYAGTLPLAQVYRYDDGDKWTLTGQLDKTPDVKYRRAWTMAEFQGRLFVGTLPSGHVYSMQAGQCVSYDRPFPFEWRHVAVTREQGQLRLYLDGQVVAAATPTAPAVTPKLNRQPAGVLELGRGSYGGFHGWLSDARIYRGALSPKQIADLLKP